MKIIFILLISFYSLGLFAGKNNKVFFYYDFPRNFKKSVEVVNDYLNFYLKEKGYKKVMDKNKICEDLGCRLESKQQGKNSGIYSVVQLMKTDLGVKLKIDLYDLKLNKKYSVVRTYEGSLNNEKVFGKFSYDLFDEVFKKLIEKREEIKPELNKDIFTNIRDERSWGAAVALGGSVGILGITFDKFILNGHIDLELSFLLIQPFAIGLKYYISPMSNSSVYLGVHLNFRKVKPITSKLFYFPVGLELISDDGFTFAAELGMIYDDNKWDAKRFFPWGGLKLGGHF